MVENSFKSRLFSIVISGAFIAATLFWMFAELDGNKVKKTNEPNSGAVSSEIQPSVSENESSQNASKQEVSSKTPAEEETTDKPVEKSFFDDACFLGDSVSLGLSRYNAKKGGDLFGKAKFLTVGSYSVHHAVNNKQVKLKYQGKTVTPQKGIKDMGAKKVFIMLGLNDCVLYGVDKTMKKWDTLVSNIRKENPGIKIYIQSATPVTKNGEKGKFANKTFDEYNKKLKAFAEKNKCVYLDISAQLKDKNGYLPKNYSSDDYVHLNDKGCQIWIDYLYNNA